MKFRVLLWLAGFVVGAPLLVHADKQFDFKKASPTEYLSFLCDLKQHDYVVEDVSESWIKKADITILIEKVGDTRECASTRSVYSSFIDPSRSTVGREAAFLIEGFRKHKYPPALNSTQFEYDAAEIVKWYRGRHNPNQDETHTSESTVQKVVPRSSD